jgi:hypothetical protein
MATPESKVKAAVKKMLETSHVYFFMPATHGFGSSGVFDIVACYKGHTMGIETKATCKDAPTGLQSRNAARAKAAGATVLLVHKDNTHVVQDVLTAIDKGEISGTTGKTVWPFDSVETCWRPKE